MAVLRGAPATGGPLGHGGRLTTPQDDAAPPLGRAGKSETNTVGDDEDAARHQDGPSGSAVMAPRAHSSRRARSSGWGGSLT